MYTARKNLTEKIFKKMESIIDQTVNKNNKDLNETLKKFIHDSN